MKKNLVLFGTFILLLIAVYIFQEKRVETQMVAQDLEGKVFVKPLTELKFGDINAIKNASGQWFSGDKLLSHNSMTVIERKISQIKKVKDVTGDWKTFFSDPIRFNANGIIYTLGDMNLDKTGFYMGHGNKVMVAYIEGESQLTTESTEIDKIKLDELRAHLSKPLSEMVEKQLFRYYPELPMDRISIESEGRLAFELDLKNNQTLPPPIKGISVHGKLREKFISLLTQITIKQQVPYSKDLNIKMGTIKFMNDKTTFIWELNLKNKKSADAYIVDHQNKKAFFMVGGTLKTFFIQFQDYWDKKNIPPADFKSFSNLPVEFVQGRKSDRVMVKNREPLSFTAQKFKVVPGPMDSLFQVLFNLGQFEQAERVSQLSNSEKQMMINENLLRINVMGQELYLWRKKEELIVVNLTQGFKAHFTLLDEKFHGQFEDVLR